MDEDSKHISLLDESIESEFNALTEQRRIFDISLQELEKNINTISYKEPSSIQQIKNKFEEIQKQMKNMNDSISYIKNFLKNKKDYDKLNKISKSIYTKYKNADDKFKNAFSGIWWSMSTLLTVGYGDIYPITPIGQFMAIVIALLGVGVVAIPTGIISAGFVEQYTKLSQEQDIQLHTVVVDVDSLWLGKTFREIEEEFGVDVVVAKRGNKTILPIQNEDFHVQIKDALYVYETEKIQTKASE